MLVWLLVLIAVLLVTPALLALARLAKRLARQQRQGFARHPASDPITVDTPAPLTRKKPDWVVHEVLRLKALMGKGAGCRKVADTFNRLHAPDRVGKSFVSNTIRNHQYEIPCVRVGKLVRFKLNEVMAWAKRTHAEMSGFGIQDTSDPIENRKTLMHAIGNLIA